MSARLYFCPKQHHDSRSFSYQDGRLDIIICVHVSKTRSLMYNVIEVNVYDKAHDDKHSNSVNRELGRYNYNITSNGIQ